MPPTQPLVSILAPTYKHGAFLRECVESVLAQGYENWELLVREDGEPDPRVLAGLDDPRVSYTGQEPRGLWRLHETYNELLAEARGELVAILEGDDVWPADKLSRQVQVHREHPEVVVSFGEAVRIGEHGEPLSRWSLTGVPTGRPFEALPTLLLGCPFAAVTAMIRRDALVRIGGFVQPYAMPAVDYPTWIGLAETGPFFAVPAVLGRWRVHQGNASTEHIVPLARGSRRITLDHADAAEAPRVRRHWNRVERSVLNAVGRSALERRDWSEARGAFRQAAALDLGREPVPLLKAAAGMALAILHVPVRGRKGSI